MLQIIGWLGCVYLIVKALEISANPTFRDPEDNTLNGAAIAAVAIACFAALGFALWFLIQGSQAAATSPLPHFGPAAVQSDINVDDCLNPDINAAQADIPCDQLPNNGV